MNDDKKIILELIDVHKTFPFDRDSIEVLKGVDLMVESAQTIAITGVSGSGKSTLLHIIGTLERPTKGKVKIDSKDIADMKEEELSVLRNRYIGFVFQFYHLLPELDALENTMLPCMIGRRDPKKIRKEAEQILERVGLSHRLFHKVGELSGGEQQRVAIARALVNDPKILLADEPTGCLDTMTGEEIMELLLSLNREKGITIVLATHNIRLSKKMERQMELIDGVLKEI
ncbi:MAG TPA: ABC transporter ATP-binding protein [Desulfobacteraceae bacterium]|nr:ABC transporter ATP-binding protein [Desulfobacteraceae bacterium]